MTVESFISCSRKLVTVRKIDAINPIPKADAIEVASIGGWKVVVKKGEFKAGDRCMYFEIDSFLPKSDPMYDFLMKSTKMMDGVEGHKLRTIRLRGQLSQGLALPLAPFIERFIDSKWDEGQEPMEFFYSGMDFSEFTGVVKYEPPVPLNMQGLMKGEFPSYIKRTDQERCQNLVEEIFTEHKDDEYEVSIKLDGTSATYYSVVREPGNPDSIELGACSRNIELKLDPENDANLYIHMLKTSGLGAALEAFARADLQLAIQGEIMGPKIQNNREGLTRPTFFIFEIQNIATRTNLPPAVRRKVYETMIDLMGVDGEVVKHVPLGTTAVTLAQLGVANIEDLLALAAGPSLTNPVREGLVFKNLAGDFSFKVISNEYLLEVGDRD